MIKVWNLGLMSFDTALKLQTAVARKHLDAIAKGLDSDNDSILLVEHKPVYTIGIRDKTSQDEIIKLRSIGAEFMKTNRGGLITFHGPGQLVAYPIINLKHFKKPSVKCYVNKLEEVIIQLCSDLGIQASRSPHTGVWVGDNKIAAIGIHASRYITTHGLALNCNTDLSWFDHITPCGIEGKGVTSLAKETNSSYTIEKAIPVLLKNFENVFECSCSPLDIDVQKTLLNDIYKDLIHQITATQQWDNVNK